MGQIIKTYNEVIDETLYYKELESGLKVYFIPKAGYTKKYGFFATRYGSMENDFEVDGKKFSMPLGIAHFLEHKIFESEEEGTFEKFSKLGANVNAYTNFISTCYLFNTVENFDECMESLMDFVQKPYLTEENVEKEKGIIAQEIKMYDDNPGWRVYFNLLSSMYDVNPIKYDIAGTVESINKITVDDLNNCYDNFYNPQNMMVLVVGDLDAEEVFELVEKSQGERFLNNKKKPVADYGMEPGDVSKELVTEKMMVATPQFYVGIKDDYTKLGQREDLKYRLVRKIGLDILFGRASEFYKENYEEGIINGTFSFDYSRGTGHSYFILGGESDRVDEAKGAILKVMENPVDLIKEESFDRIVKKMKGRFLSSFNSLDYVSSNFISYYMNGNNLLDYLDVVDSITTEDIVDAFKNTKTEKRVVLSVIDKM